MEPDPGRRANGVPVFIAATALFPPKGDAGPADSFGVSGKVWLYRRFALASRDRILHARAESSFSKDFFASVLLPGNDTLHAQSSASAGFLGRAKPGRSEAGVAPARSRIKAAVAQTVSTSAILHTLEVSGH